MSVNLEMDALATDATRRGNSLIFYETAPELRHFAVFKVAAYLISIELTALRNNFGNDDQAFGRFCIWAANFYYRNFPTTLLASMKMKLEICEKMILIARSLPEWIKLHSNSLDNIITRLPTQFLLDFVWKWNGQLDYVLTAQNLLNGHHLSIQERFRMLCAYCAKPELEDGRDIFYELYHGGNQTDLYINDNVYYWYLRIIDRELAGPLEIESDDSGLVETLETDSDGRERVEPLETDNDDRERVEPLETDTDDGELEEPLETDSDDGELEEPSETDNDDGELEEPLETDNGDRELEKPLKTNSKKIPYERNMLDTQFAFNLKAIDFYFTELLIDNDESAYDYCQHQLLLLPSYMVKFLLSRLNESQQQRVFEKIPVCYLMEKFLIDSCPHFALQLWNHVKYSMSGKIFVYLMRASILEERFSMNDLPYPDCMEDLAMELWTNTPWNLKKFVFEHQSGIFISDWPHWFCENVFRNDLLLWALLGDVDIRFRDQFWTREWPRLIAHSRPVFLRRFMIICITRFHEIREFERRMLASDAMFGFFQKCLESWNVRLIIKLIKFLDIFIPDLDRRTKLKARLTREIVTIPSVFFDNELVNFRVFWVVLVNFFHDVDQGNKRNLICRWLAELIVMQQNQPLKCALAVFDNIMFTAQRLCDRNSLMLIVMLTPPRHKFDPRRTQNSNRL